MGLGCGSLSITIPVSHLANERNIQSLLHGQVNLAAVNHSCITHETMNGCKNLKVKGFLGKCKYSELLEAELITTLKFSIVKT